MPSIYDIQAPEIDVVVQEDNEPEEREKVCEGQSLEERKRIRRELNEHKNRVINDKQVSQLNRHDHTIMISHTAYIDTHFVHVPSTGHGARSR